MPFKVVISARAERHLDDLFCYIAERASEKTATAYVERVLAYCNGLASAPHRGTRRDEILPGMRTVGFRRRITVTFVIEETNVVILGLYYGGRDFAADFRDEAT
jgi:toxin ParE1/3/4